MHKTLKNCAVGLAAALCMTVVSAEVSPEVSVALGHRLGVKPQALQIEAQSIENFKRNAAPARNTVGTPYAKQYRELVEASRAGGQVVRWSHRGSPFAEGYAIITGGQVIATLITARS